MADDDDLGAGVADLRQAVELGDQLGPAWAFSITMTFGVGALR